jgi:hypothetical protein
VAGVNPGLSIGAAMTGVYRVTIANKRKQANKEVKEIMEAYKRLKNTNTPYAEELRALLELSESVASIYNQAASELAVTEAT